MNFVLVGDGIHQQASPSFLRFRKVQFICRATSSFRQQAGLSAMRRHASTGAPGRYQRPSAEFDNASGARLMQSSGKRTLRREELRGLPTISGSRATEPVSWLTVEA